MPIHTPSDSARLPAFCLLLTCVSCIPCLAGAAGLSSMLPESNARFEVRALDVSHQYILSRQRSRMQDLAQRHLGAEFRGDRRDLQLLQRLSDLMPSASTNLSDWQAAGVILGDVIANETNLHWVTVEDELGSSRALQWKRSQNFVFPVTLLSRRVQFNQALDVEAVFDQVLAEVAAFKTWEAGRFR